MKVTQSCPTLCDPIGYTVHGMLQARILGWGAIPFSRRSSNPWIEPRSPALQADSLPSEPPGKPRPLLRICCCLASLRVRDPGDTTRRISSVFYDPASNVTYHHHHCYVPSVMQTNPETLWKGPAQGHGNQENSGQFCSEADYHK